MRSLVAIALAAVASGCAAPAPDLTAADLVDWLRAYERAWETKDAGLAATLFAADGVYLETPYTKPFKGRGRISEYWAGATAGQDHVDFAFEPLAVSGNSGIVHWTAELTSASAGTAIELDGIMVLEFNDAGLVTTLREWWHSRDRVPLGGLGG